MNGKKDQNYKIKNVTKIVQKALFDSWQFKTKISFRKIHE